MPASMAFVTDSNRPQPLWQPPPTACLTAAGAASVVPSLQIPPWLQGPIYQYIDTAALRANNEQTVMPIDDAPFLKWKTTVSANLELESDSVVAVQFEKFGIGVLLPAPFSPPPPQGCIRTAVHQRRSPPPPLSPSNA